MKIESFDLFANKNPTLDHIIIQTYIQIQIQNINANMKTERIDWLANILTFLPSSSVDTLLLSLFSNVTPPPTEKAAWINERFEKPQTFISSDRSS